MSFSSHLQWPIFPSSYALACSPYLNLGWLEFWTIKFRESDFIWPLNLSSKKPYRFSLSLRTLVQWKPVQCRKSDYHDTTMLQRSLRKENGEVSWTENQPALSFSSHPSRGARVLNEDTVLDTYLLLPLLQSDCNLLKDLKSPAEPS